MRNTKNLKIFTAALLVALAVPAVQAQSGQSRANQGGDLIALRAEVDGRDRPYTLKEPTTETIPLREGERIRVHLMGTVVDRTGTGKGRPIHARFSIAAGGDQIDIVQTGPNWVVVHAKPHKREGLGQILYEVTDNYAMKDTWKTGRLTFRVEDSVAGTAPITPPVEQSRWDRAADLTDQLYRSILGVAPQGNTGREDVEHVYVLGLAGVRDVALALAEDAGSRYDRLPQDAAVEVLGNLYRGLLRREGSNEQIWNQDPGFRTNVDTLRRQGYEKIVEVIVDAGEFRTANNLMSFGSLAGQDDPNWRNERGRYAIQQD